MSEELIIEEKLEPVEIEEVAVAASDEADPRAAIYAKVKERRSQEKEGTPIGIDPTQQPQVAAPIDPNEMVTVKINGREKQVSRAKVEEAGGLDIYQKRHAAEESMRHAADEKRRVQEYEQQLNVKAQQLQRYEHEIKQRAVQQPASPPPPNQDEVKQMARQYHEAILNGDMDQADDLLIKLQGTQRSAIPDVAVITKQAAAEARAALAAERDAERQAVFERKRQEANAMFEEDFSDVATDPDLRTLANQKTARIYQENPDWEPAQIIGEAARQVREAYGKSVTTPDTSKLEAKRAMTNIKGGSAKAMPKAAPRPPTNSQYVENLRKQRGLE